MYYSLDFYKAEKIKNENNLNGLAEYNPMGVDFKLGRKNEFWKLMHLFLCKMRLGINIVSILGKSWVLKQEVVAYTIGFGLRVSMIRFETDRLGAWE